MQIAKPVMALGLLIPIAHGQSFEPADIPVGLRSHAGSGNIRKAHQVGSITCDALKEVLTVTWRSSALENQAPDWSLQWDLDTGALGTHFVQTVNQEFSVGYYPTAAAVVDDSTILVGGVDKAGTTILESWSLVWPKMMSGVYTDPNTGLSQVQPMMVTVSTRKRLYDDSAVGKTFVQNICAVRRQSGKPVDYMVQFGDSSDVYIGAVQGGALSLLGSSQTSAGTIGTVPGLEGDSQTVLMASHFSGLGYVYQLLRQDPSGRLMNDIEAPKVLRIIFVDTDLDGVIDNYLQPTQQEWDDQGWADLDNYVNWWLD